MKIYCDNAAMKPLLPDENITDEQIDYLINTIKGCVAKMR